jgi:tetratricopeptide (TPR) repeat protein
MANDMDGTENLARQALKNAQADSDRGLIEYALELLNYLWLTNEVNQKGIEFFSEFLERHTDDATAFHCRGIHLWYSGHPEEAIADYNRSNNAGVYFNRAQAHDKRNDYLKAVADYKKSLVSEEPKLPAYKRNLAESRVKELGALGFEGAP